MADTRQRLIETAHGLFYRNGFISVGLDQILGEVGVTKTTFYNHFPSKDDLILAVLQHHDEWWRQTFSDLLRKRGGLHPHNQLNAVFDVIQDVFDGGDYKGCIFINVAVEFPGTHQPAHQAARTHKLAMERIIFDLAVASGATDPQAFAEEFSMLMEGAFVMQHVTGNPKTTEIARRVATLLIEKHLPARGASTLGRSPLAGLPKQGPSGQS